MFCVKAPRELRNRVNTGHLLPVTVGEMSLFWLARRHGPVAFPVIQLFVKNLSYWRAYKQREQSKLLFSFPQYGLVFFYLSQTLYPILY